MLSKFPLSIWHILSLLSLLVAGLVTNMFLDGSLFSYHPIGMSIAYVVLMSEAVCTAIDFRKKEGNERVKRISRHMFVNFGALASALVGFSAIYLNKVRQSGRPHSNPTLLFKQATHPFVCCGVCPLNYCTN